MGMKVLLIEDEELIGEMIRLNLEAEGYQVQWLKDGQDVGELINERRFDLIILDIMLPGMNGIEITSLLRKRGIGTPILMLTAQSGTVTKVKSLDAGADDYVTKPFDMPELMARVRASIRRSQGRRQIPSNNLLHFDCYEVNFQTREADTNGGTVVLSEKEIELLEFFSRYPHEVVSRADILDEVWGMDVSPTERTVDNFILRLRKLFDDPEQPRHFLTIRGRGYKFVPSS